MSAHQEEILEQFTRQAAGYAQSASIRDQDALDLLVRWSAVTASERVLDVACGPGLVVCAFAQVAREATGVDMTPAMLEQARRHAAELGVSNAHWQLAEIPPLPWADDSFDVVVTRYAVHHMTDPLAMLREMVRVCAPGGRVVVCDLALAPEAVAAFNAMDRLRDPSHVRAFSSDELRELYLQAGLGEPRVTGYTLEGDLDALLARSFPAPGGEEEVRCRFHASLDDDHLGVDARRDGERITYRHPIAVLAATV
jgi:ubiquinone/menaquinone biosynthesis C-methylase UbiE